MMLWKVMSVLAVMLFTLPAFAQDRIEIVSDSLGSRLTIDGKPFFMKGMNWDYFPIGTNYSYSLWEQSDDIVKTALEREMTLLKEMGVNVIRQYNTIPPRWIQYIYETYGIYTMINHSFGRYGLTINGTWYGNTDYCREDVRELLLNEVDNFVKTYQGTPGVLMYLLGNENNYGLFWTGAESEDLPVGENLHDRRARCLYELLNEATLRIKAVDASVPVAICNGDLQFLDMIADKCKAIDVLGVNSYRGDSFDVLFRTVKEKINKPLVLTEFGADAYNVVTQQEAQLEQAEILLNNWQEIYLNAAGMGESGNCIGGFTFQFSDGWWKFGQTTRLDVHDNHASWKNGGYKFDFVPGENNMNEEWFGICAKGKPDDMGLYQLMPRKAYAALSMIHHIDPYRSTPVTIAQSFDRVRKQIRNN